MKRTSNVERRTSNFERKSNRWPLVLMLALVIDTGFVGGSRVRADVDIEHAAQSIADGVPQVAVVRLRQLLAGDLPAGERRLATAKLGEALVAAEQPEEALKLLEDPQLHDLPESRFFHAQALAALSRWAEALPLYQQMAADAASPFRAPALFGQAEALRALGRVNEALQTLTLLRRDPPWSVRAQLRSVELLLAKQDAAGATRLLDSFEANTMAERKERRFLRGSVEALQGNRERAIESFASILKEPEGATHSVLVATLFAIAEAHLQSRTPGTGDDFLEDFIDRHPTDRDLPAIFAKLDQLYAAERKQSRHELGRWSRDAAQPRRALAQWYLARAELRLGRRDTALRVFAQLRESHPPLVTLAEAFVEYAQLELEDERFDQAIAVLATARGLRPPPALRDRIDLLAGRSHYQAARFEDAAQTFQRVAQSSSPMANDALFNASLAWLQLGQPAQAAATSRELNERAGDAQPRGDLLLEEGLIQAAQGHKQAGESLQKFLRDYPRNQRVSEAWVALAELAFHAAPPRLDEARKHLARASESQPTAAASERADYLMIWIEDAGPAADETKVIGLAQQFLLKYAPSAFVPDVRMKLAETYYRRQDFASAQTQFEILAQENPLSPVAEKAQFFAAQSAKQSMGADSLERALILLGEVVKKEGDLKWAARNEQAVIERKLGRPEDALTLYDEVLKGDAKPLEKREALCGKGDILYELGSADRANYTRAIELYEQLAAQTDASAHWRNQALFKKGMCLEKLDAPAEALATFYRILEGEGQPDRPRELFWFYKAGFNAARLLEEDSKWQPAAVIYEKLAFAGGGRSEEAKSRLNRLRLEHFLWDQ
jgi:TolA-binding protein